MKRNNPHRIMVCRTCREGYTPGLKPWHEEGFCSEWCVVQFSKRASRVRTQEMRNAKHLA